MDLQKSAWSSTYWVYNTIKKSYASLLVSIQRNLTIKGDPSSRLRNIFSESHLKFNTKFIILLVSFIALLRLQQSYFHAHINCRYSSRGNSLTYCRCFAGTDLFSYINQISRTRQQEEAWWYVDEWWRNVSEAFPCRKPLYIRCKRTRLHSNKIVGRRMLPIICFFI